MHLLRRVSALAFGVVILLALEPPLLAREQVEVTCSVQGDDANVDYGLSADLDCTGIAPSVVQLSKGNRLYLNGHTMTGVVIAAYGNVQIIGPGTLTGTSYDGIRHTAGVLTVRDTAVTGHLRYGINSLAGRVKLDGATVSGNGIDGVAAFRSVVAKNTVVTGNARFGISTQPDGMVEGGAPCTVTAKATIRLLGSTVTGNGTDAGCGTSQACADLATCSRVPKLKATTCDTSYVRASGLPGNTLGVCGAD